MGTYTKAEVNAYSHIGVGLDLLTDPFDSSTDQTIWSLCIPWSILPSKDT